MNLIQITEQLKNPAVSVQQLMQYANNTNPEVPSYVALAEMQRRQSMQAPAQVPQQTVKDQLGAQLMGLPSVAPETPQPMPQPMPQPTPQSTPQQPLQQPMQQVQMPQPKPALPTQPGMKPGMAGGGLASIPVNMHRDFAKGGIIAFAGGGEPDPGAYPQQMTIDEARAEREMREKQYNFGGDPYAEAKRRYTALEEKQLEREKEAGSDRFWAGLAAYGSAGPRGFAQAAGNASQVMQNMAKQQQTESDAQSTKMAELHTLWGKEQDALNRAKLAADEGKVNEKRELMQKAAQFRLERQKAEATTTQAAAAARNAETNAGELALKNQELPVKLALYKAQAAREGRAPPSIEETKLYMSDSKYAAAYDKMQSIKNGGKGEFTREDAMKLAFPGGVMPGIDPQEGINTANKIYEAVNKAKTGGGLNMVTLPDGRSLSFPTAEAAAEFKKKAGLQ
jgi:hypothetical protein